DITVTGGTVDPSKYPITIANGWNWIGYPVSQALDVNDALGNMSCTEEDVLKSRNGFTTYIDGYGWWGSLNTLNPGEGYQYQSKASSTVSFTYPSSRTNILRANIGTEGNYWTPNDDFANNINIMASIPADAVVNASEDVEIGAFVNNECRGSAKLMYVEPLDSYIAFLTVYGEVDDLVTFNVYAEGNQYETSDQVVFTEDAVVGKASNPFMLHLNGDNSLSLFPNPANKGERVTVELNGNVDFDNAVIEVYNTLGSLVRTEPFSPSDKTMESLQNSGIYTIKVTDANGNTFIGKLIVR
ncbi:MAG: T9SS type A sorting domain-containing protein, partial [Bacteroidales bacterium]|nr:T9SS type A sorting domain-containing protein [Bacteroidales bacterium]